MIIGTFLLFLVHFGAVHSADSPLNRLRAKIPVKSVGHVMPAQLAGQYTTTSKELAKRIGGGFLSGEDLYLFPDSTYLSAEWGDIEPVTLNDKGSWKFTGGILVLKSDADVTWDPRTARTYLVVHRVSRSREILLVGVERDLTYLEKNSERDPEFTLLMVAKQRARTLSQQSATKLKTRLMKEAWRPEFFQKPLEVK